MSGVAGVGYAKTAGNQWTGKSAGSVKESYVQTYVKVSYKMNFAEGKESVVDEYKKEHPEDAAHVEGQTAAGKRVLAKNGVENISREAMTMEEYKSFFGKLLDSIPYDPSRLGEKEIINISKEGWEQMKNDSDYEAWVLGYEAEDRAVRNPFAGFQGASGNMHIENFGASIEEHHGESFSMGNTEKNGRKTEDSMEDWWQRRHKRIKELIQAGAEQAKIRKEASEKQLSEAASAYEAISIAIPNQQL